MQKPLTKTVVSYAYKVQVRGNDIGTLQGFNPSFNRELVRVRELGDTTNDIKEIVPGRADFTITIDRLETYDQNFAQALSLGITQIIPSNQSESITIVEIIESPSGQRRIVTYVDCWIQSYSKTIREGTLTVAEQVTVWPTRITVR